MLDIFGCLTLAAGVIMRHIVFIFSVSLTKFPAMMNSFAILLCGRALKSDEFVSKRTVKNHITRINLIDDHLIAQEYEKIFNVEQKYGFKCMWYSATDDTKHGKAGARYVALQCGDMGLLEDDGGFSMNPFFDCLSTAQSTSKDWKGYVAHILLERNCAN